MTKICDRCGKELSEGQTRCVCGEYYAENSTNKSKSIWEKMQNKMGIGDPELNQGDAFERGKLIIPEVVKTMEGETPVKQYEVAVLKNRFFGITFAKAIGRIQVTNKRIIFRAPGRCFLGRTSLQQEFSMNEISGLELKRDYGFHLGDLIIGFVSALLVATLFTTLFMGVFDDPVIVTLINLLLGGAGLVPFFLVNKKWYLKTLALGVSLSMLGVGYTFYNLRDYFNDGFLTFMSILLLIFGIVALVTFIISLIFFAVKPNIALVFKNKMALNGIEIKRRNTGYFEVLPTENTEYCVKEINALIEDIKNNGDAIINKWHQ